MTDRPIIFSTPMVQAILANRKWKTRRLIKPQPIFYDDGWIRYGNKKNWKAYANESHLRRGLAVDFARYKKGDLLYVKENYWVVELPGCGIGNRYIIFDEEWENREPNPGERLVSMADSHMRWGHHPSIHLPKKFSRLRLRVTDVRVERVQDISEEDAVAEGCKQQWTCLNPGIGSYAVERTAVEEFQALWNAIHGPGAWERNDWVWVISFEREK